jgi:hypothetical protein
MAKMKDAIEDMKEWDALATKAMKEAPILVQIRNQKKQVVPNYYSEEINLTGNPEYSR